MKTVFVRRISQLFFLAFFLWFCITSTLGVNWWQLRGWPVNWFLELDPLVGFSTLITTGTIYKGLIWGVGTVILTLVFGRFFCGWLCPFGTLHQFIGFCGKLGRSSKDLSHLNRYRKAQSIKYGVLIFFISSCIATTLLKITAPVLAGILDPIPFVYRLVNLTILPFADNAFLHLSANPRYYDGAWIIGGLGISALLLNLWIPRFYCRYICPLGALFGLISNISFWQIGKKTASCTRCVKCQLHCEGACEPMDSIRISECIMCMNCLEHCDFMTYHSSPSNTSPLKSKSLPSPQVKDISRRNFMVSMISGATVVPMMHIDASTGSNWNAALIRPPGALPESQFLSRCIRCGQCIRICPTNVIQAADIMTGGFEGLWTPVLNFRIGSSGCQLHCIACGNVCPTGAIVPLELDQRTGINKYSENGPIRTGSAFVDQGRCLPWSMNRPCIVCQENCPVSPKAIMTRESFVVLKIAAIKSNPDKSGVSLSEERLAGSEKSFSSDNIRFLDISDLIPGQYSTGDYFAKDTKSQTRSAIIANTENSITLSSDSGNIGFKEESKITIELKLQRPAVDPGRCIGCGVCEHECPVKGKRAIRVTAENESRDRRHTLTG